jgi:predicted transcriptional regulator
VANRIMGLTADIVSAYIANNKVSAAGLSDLIRNAYQALAAVGEDPVEPTKPESVGDAIEYVFADHIVSLDCGRSFRVLTRHNLTDHGMMPDEYRTNSNLPMSYSMVAAEYVARRSTRTIASGLRRKRKVAGLRRR